MDDLIDGLKSLFGDSLNGLKQSQNEALIDALVGAMVADETVTAHEEDELKKSLERLDWKGKKTKSAYLDESKKKATEANTGDWTTFVTSISERLGEQWLRRDCYYLAARLCGVDDDLPESESHYLRTMVRIFDIDNEELQTITTTLRDEINF